MKSIFLTLLLLLASCHKQEQLNVSWSTNESIGWGTNEDENVWVVGKGYKVALKTTNTTVLKMGDTAVVLLVDSNTMQRLCELYSGCTNVTTQWEVEEK